MGYIDETAAASKAILNIMANRWVDNRDEITENREKIAAALEAAKALSISDEKLRDGANAYLDIQLANAEKLDELTLFILNYIDFLDYHADKRPALGKGENLGDFCERLYYWWQSTREIYDTMECPSAEEEWLRFGKLFDLCGIAVQRLILAGTYQDWLRFRTSMDLLDRFTEYTNITYTKILDVFDGPIQFMRKKYQRSATLLSELREYAKMSPAKRKDYTFKTKLEGVFVPIYQAEETIYPALYNSYDAFLIISAGCYHGTRDIVVEAEIPGFTQKYRESFRLNQNCQYIYIKPPVLSGIDLTHEKSGQMQVSLYEKDGKELIESKNFPVRIMSRNDFSYVNDDFGQFTADNFLCYLQPQSEAVSRLKRKAADEMSNMTGGYVESFAGYQDLMPTHYMTTYLQVAGIMRAMYDLGIRYAADTFSYNDAHQHILFPEEVIEQQSGLCIETTLLVASALQSAGMHAYLVLPRGHAQVAVEVWNAGGEEVGAGEYFLIETTCLEKNSNSDAIFIQGLQQLSEGEPTKLPIQYMSRDEWYSYVMNDELCLIDCDDFNGLGIRSFVN